jgi:hypothetical protein
MCGVRPTLGVYGALSSFCGQSSLNWRLEYVGDRDRESTYRPSSPKSVPILFVTALVSTELPTAVDGE